jgi:TorA maturation chaperone TorD
VCEDAYRKFLTDHLGRWYEAFLHRLTEAAEEEYYREIGTLLKAVIAAETAGLGGQVQKLTQAPAESLQGCTWECEA